MGFLDILGSGYRDDLIFTIDVAYFTHDAAYKDGKPVLLKLTGHDEEGETYEKLYNVGEQWDTFDGGRTLRPVGKAKSVNKQSMYGHFMTSAYNCGPIPAAILDTRDPLVAETWVGLTFHLKEVEIKFGKGLDPVTQLMPIEYFPDDASTHGSKNVQQQFPVSPASVPVSPASVPVFEDRPASVPQTPVPASTAVDLDARRASILAAAQGVGPGPGPSPLVAQLSAMAKASPDPTTFLNSALALDALLLDDALVTAVSTGAFFAEHH